MNKYRFGLITLTLAALACSVLSPGGAPTVAPMATDTPLPLATDVPAATDTAAAPTEPAATEAPTEAPTEAGPEPVVRIVVAGPDATPHLVDLQGASYPISEMQEPLYVFTYALNTDLSQPGHAYNISSAGVFPLDVVQNVGLGFAAYVGPAAPNGLLAWDTYTVAEDGSGLTGTIHISSPDGSDAHVAYEEFSPTTMLRVWRWAADGQHLYFSKEPTGLGGYIPFDGRSNVWVLSLADGSIREIAPNIGNGLICVDDLTPDESLLAHHCTPGVIEVDVPGTSDVATIHAPPEAENLLVGDARFSPDAGRVAFSFALGVPDAEQGWVAVTAGLDDTAQLVAKADAGTLFQVIQWLDADTLLLQQTGANPGVYLGYADGHAPALRLADGQVLGVIDNLAGQPAPPQLLIK